MGIMGGAVAAPGLSVVLPRQPGVGPVANPSRVHRFQGDSPERYDHGMIAATSSFGSAREAA
jgi:hypothetical protein